MINDRIKILSDKIIKSHCLLQRSLPSLYLISHMFIQYNAELDYDAEGERCLQKWFCVMISDWGSALCPMCINTRNNTHPHSGLQHLLLQVKWTWCTYSASPVYSYWEYDSLYTFSLCHNADNRQMWWSTSFLSPHTAHSLLCRCVCLRSICVTSDIRPQAPLLVTSLNLGTINWSTPKVPDEYLVSTF